MNNRSVQVYVGGEKLDLFDDENIEITSTQQNVKDISKVFADFSQSFSVPASTKNNAIFEHFYENDINGQLDYNLRRPGAIEIDLTPFRKGLISLEKSEIKNNKPYSYQITFYGDITSLKDRFAEDFLRDLDYLSTYNFTYDAQNVLDRITDGGTDYDARFPLISTNRAWQYGGGGTDDLTIDDGALQYNDLFPNLKIDKIFKSIEEKYDLEFVGTFLENPRFKECFLWCRPGDLTPDKIPGTDTQNLVFDTIGQFLEYEYIGNSVINQGRHVVRLTVTPSSEVIPYTINVYDFGTPYSTINSTGTQTFTIIDEPDNPISLQRIFSFQAYGDFPMTISAIVHKDFYSWGENGFPPPQFIESVVSDSYATPNYNLIGQINFPELMPEMKVETFFAGILKEFNLTCYALSKDKYVIEPLADWYAKGDILDITKYTDIESIQVDRIKLFKRISFSYQESESFLNSRFRALNNRQYGDVEADFLYDGGEYKIEVPFENLLFNLFSGTSLQVGYVLDPAFVTYKNKPMLHYNTGNYDNFTIKFFDGVNYSTINNAQIFGQDLTDINIDYSLNFGAEFSSFHLIPIPNGLYQTYYNSYIQNLYNRKNRETAIKTILPVSILSTIEVNDRLIIRDKRYMINEMKSNLTTGEVNFTLLNDFSEVIVDGGSDPGPPITPGPESQCIQQAILFPKQAIQADISSPDPGVTITPSTLTNDGTVEICIPLNPDEIGLLVTEDDSAYINTEDGNRYRTEEGTPQIYTVNVVYTYINGTQTTSQIFIQQQP